MSLSRQVRVVKKGHEIAVDGVDFTGKVARFAYEATDSEEWVHIEPKGDVDLDLLLPEWSIQFGVSADLTPQEVEQAVIDAMGYGSGENSIGDAVVALLRSKGIEVRG